MYGDEGSMRGRPRTFQMPKDKRCAACRKVKPIGCFYFNRYYYTDGTETKYPISRCGPCKLRANLRNKRLRKQLGGRT